MEIENEREKRKLKELEELLKDPCEYCATDCSWTIQCQYFELNPEKVREVEITRESIEKMARDPCSVCNIICDQKNRACQDFELMVQEECSIPCDECYMFNLGLCEGYDEEYCVMIDL